MDELLSTDYIKLNTRHIKAELYSNGFLTCLIVLYLTSFSPVVCRSMLNWPVARLILVDTLVEELRMKRPVSLVCMAVTRTLAV